jgi:hypothetical protein
MRWKLEAIQSVRNNRSGLLQRLGTISSLGKMSSVGGDDNFNYK